MEIVSQDILGAYDGCRVSGLADRRYSLSQYYDELRLLYGDGSRVEVDDTLTTPLGHNVEAWSLGRGHRIKVMLWSQMHGNEPVSTLALLDVLSFLIHDKGYVAEAIRGHCHIIAIPLLNPDGHERNDRRNAMGIDINRDAKDLTSPEAGFLMKVFEDNRPDLALNLHDQELYYTVGSTLNATLISLLAPECSEDGSVPPNMRNAMQVAGYVARQLESVYPGRIAKYQDSYTPTAFGDTFQSKGASAVLIEAGSWPQDHGRLVSRKAMFLAIVSAVYSMVVADGKSGRKLQYENLPINRRYNAFDLVLRHLDVPSATINYTMDIGIRRIKPTHNPEDFTDDFDDYRIQDMGNLGARGAIVDFDASGCRLVGSGWDLRIGSPADFLIEDAHGGIINVKDLLNYR